MNQDASFGLNRKTPRRAFIKKFFGLTFGGMLAGGGFYRYITHVAPYTVEVVRRDLDVGLAARGLSPVLVAHLSDLHESRDVPLSYLTSCFEQVGELKPDLICLTGDYITNRIHNFTGYQKALKILSSAAPTFASLGNHDAGVWYYRGIPGYQDGSKITYLLKSAGIQVLRNESIPFVLKRPTKSIFWPDGLIDYISDDCTLRITGLGDIYSRECKPSLAMKQKKGSEEAHIVLSHNPDSKSLITSYSWDVLLCGHTHGGQIRIPFVGAPILPIRDRRFAEGLHQWQKRWVYVTRGLGNLHGFRWNCPPEITLLRLV